MSKNQVLPNDINILAKTIEELVSQGLNQNQVAIHLGVTPKYLINIKSKHVVIKDAILRGREMFVKDLPKAVQDSIIKQVQGYEYEEVETLYDVHIGEHGEEIQTVRARRITKKHAKPNATITKYVADAILSEWDDPEDVKEEKSELQLQLGEVKKNKELVEFIKKQLRGAYKKK